MMQPIVPPAYSETPMPQSGWDSQNPLISASNQGQGQWQQPYSMNGCTQMIYTCRPVSKKCENYKTRQSLVVSIGQIIVGILCIAFNATLIPFGAHPHHNQGAQMGFVSHGIWGGIFFIIAGGLGIGAAKTKSKCLIIAFMVLCIISAMSAAVVLSLGVLGAVMSYNSLPLAMNILLAIFAIVEGILAIWGSVLCCTATCCCAPTTGTFMLPGQPVQFLPMNGNQPTVVFLTVPPSVPQYVGYASGHPDGYSMQFATAAAANQPSINVQANPNGSEIVGPLMEKIPLTD